MPVWAEGSERTVDGRWAGIQVQHVVVSLARGRVAFSTRVGQVVGDIETDLNPGRYTLDANVPNMQWIVRGPGVREGLRFSLELEGVDPWVLSYPPGMPMDVLAGSAEEPRTAGDMIGPNGALADPTWLSDATALLPGPVTSIDDFDSLYYDIDYRSEHGGLSKWITVTYRDGRSRDFNIDNLTPSTPRLYAARAEVLRIMDDYNAMFILGSAFPTVFMLLFLAPMPGGVPGVGSVRRVPVPRGSRPPAAESGTPEPSPPAAGRTTEPVPPATGAAPEAAQARALAQSIAARGEEVIVNIGGAGSAHEPPGAINLNNQAVPRSGIPNLVKADGSRIGELFLEGSVARVEGHRMAPGVVDWTRAAPGAFRVLRSGGQFRYSFQGANPDAEVAATELRRAGFTNVQNLRDVLVIGTKP